MLTIGLVQPILIKLLLTQIQGGDKASEMKKLTAGVLLACLWLLIELIPGAKAQGSCDPGTECCIADCQAEVEFPTKEECIADPCSCAQKLDCIVRTQRDGWNTYPLNGELHLNTAVTHGRYLETRVNPTAEASINNFLPPAPGPVEIAYGSIIVKDNYRPDPEEPSVPLMDDTSPFPTLIVKLKGYCLESPNLGRDCPGGEWFWSKRVGDKFTSIGKPGSCLGCHAAVAEGDWMWNLFIPRRFPPEGN